MPTESEPVLISTLNEYVFCPRRCALKVIDGHWEDNEHTSMGTLLHDHTDEPGYEIEKGVKILRALPLFSSRYGLVGKADIVEVRDVKNRAGDPESGISDSGLNRPPVPIQPDSPESNFESRSTRKNLEAPNANPETNAVSHLAESKFHGRKKSIEKLYAPVEYKKGRRRKFENDDIQLCGQALCLEEMFQTTVPSGYIYHAASKRRREVVFTQALRLETLRAIENVRDLMKSKVVPAARLMPRCDGCSLRDVCLPELTGEQHPADDYLWKSWMTLS